MLKIPATLREEIRDHGKSAYPHECCGLLLGSLHGRDTIVTRIHRAQNIRRDRKHDRFELNPKDYLEADRIAREIGQAIVGFYHSHPDHPARPSPTDLRHAHLVYSYVIVRVDRGGPGEISSWLLREDASGFDEQEIQVQ